MALVERKISEYVTRYPYQGAEEDAQGNESESWGEDPDPIGIWAFDPGGISEPREPGRDAVISEPTIFLPTGSPFGAHDECLVRGKRYQVVGDPADWLHPSRRLNGDVIKLRRVDG